MLTDCVCSQAERPSTKGRSQRHEAIASDACSVLLFTLVLCVIFAMQGRLAPAETVFWPFASLAPAVNVYFLFLFYSTMQFFLHFPIFHLATYSCCVEC